MADWSAIRTALKTRLETITDLTVYDKYQRSEFRSPAAIVGGPVGREFQINYHVRKGPRDVAEWIVPIDVMVSGELPNMGQDELDKYLDSDGATSVAAALEGERTLGGIAHDLKVTKCEDYGIGSTTGVRFTVVILA